MKSILSCLLLIASFVMQAQEKTDAVKGTSTYTISKTELSKVKLLSDLIPNLRENYSYVKYEITYKIGETVMVSSGTGNELKEKEINSMSKVKINSKMYIDVLTHVNKIPYSDAYSFYVTE